MSKQITTTIRLSIGTKEWLDTLKIVPQESYENLLLRILNGGKQS